MLSTLPPVNATPSASVSGSAPPSHGGSPAPGEAPDSDFAHRLEQAQRQEPPAKAAAPRGPSKPATGKPAARVATPHPARPETEADAQAAKALPAAQLGDAATPASAGPAGVVAQTPVAEEPKDLSALLAHLRGHSPVVAPPPAAGTGNTPTTTDVGTPLAGNGSATKSAAPRQPGLEADKGHHGGLEAAGTAAQNRDVSRTDPAADFGQHLAAQQAAIPAPPPAPVDVTPQPLPQAQSVNAAPAPSPAPAEAALRATPGSAEFAPQLGAQITTFIRDGVEHARLHLNPADMGPVTVQIQLDGQTAQVHLLAEHGATRQALEQAMPQLAGSLQQAGLTLTGGGVFQQPREARSDGRGESRSGARSTAASGRIAGVDTLETAAAPASAPRRRGVVDLIA